MPTEPPASAHQRHRRRWQFSIRTLLVVMTIVACISGLIGHEFRKARREHEAYEELCALGAGGDDWIGWREWVFGSNYRPIVAIGIPPTVDLDRALPLLSQLDNLECLYLSGTSIDDSQLVLLYNLHSVRFLDLSSTTITDVGYNQLKQRLPQCTIER